MATAPQPADRDEVRRFIRLIETDPDVREEVRRAVLTTELLEVPRQLERLERIVADFVEATNRRLASLENRTAAMDNRLFTVDNRVSALQGDIYERRVREYAPSILSRVAGGVRRMVLLSKTDLANDLDDAVDAGRISEAERSDVLLADAVLRAVRRASGERVLLVVEASVSLANDDVARAIRRSRLVARSLEAPSVPVVVTARPSERLGTEEAEVVVYNWGPLEPDQAPTRPAVGET